MPSDPEPPKPDLDLLASQVRVAVIVEALR